MFCITIDVFYAFLIVRQLPFFLPYPRLKKNKIIIILITPYLFKSKIILNIVYNYYKIILRIYRIIGAEQKNQID